MKSTGWVRVVVTSHALPGRLFPERLSRSIFLRAKRIPIGFIARKPWQITIEQDRPSVAYGAGAQARHVTAQDATANRDMAIGSLQLQVHADSGKQPMACLDQRSARGGVDNDDSFARADAGGHDPVLFD
jgi:hypothetical protein